MRFGLGLANPNLTPTLALALALALTSCQIFGRESISPLYLPYISPISRQIFGRESDFFANMAVDAMAMVKDVDPESGKARYPVKSVGIIKQHGGSAKDSSLIHGFVLGPGMGRAAQGEGPRDRDRDRDRDRAWAAPRRACRAP